MRAIMFGGSALIIGWGAWMHGFDVGGNVYQVPADQAYEKLMTMQMAKGKNAPFYNASVKAEGDKENRVIVWTARYVDPETGNVSPRAMSKCIATIEDSSKGKSRINTNCENGGAEGGAEMGAIAAGMQRLAMIEQIESELASRPYDRRRVAELQTGYMMANMGNIQKAGLKNMDEHMALEAESDRAAKKLARENKARDAYNNAIDNAGKPTMEVGGAAK
jgi:hypothetical protein